MEDGSLETALYAGLRLECRRKAEGYGLIFVQHLSPILFLWLLARALEVEVSLLYLAGAVPLVFLSSRIPPSISRLGMRGVFMHMMSLAGLTT
jgi:hypothetical protein